VLHALSICLPLTLAAVLVVSGIAKLQHPDDLSGWDEMGVPEPLRRRWLLAAHPWTEIALGLFVLLAGGWAGLAAGVLAVVLMAVYTVLVARAVRSPEEASCACFGTRKAVTQATLARNVWLLGLAVGAACAIWWTPLLGGALVRAARSGAWGWLLGLVVAAVTTWLVTRDDPAAEKAGSGAPMTDGEDLDYVRTRTPAIPVTLADGTVQTLRELSSRKPLLLLDVSQTCGACRATIEKMPEYRQLLPEVEVRLLIEATPDRTALTEVSEPQSLHDPQGYLTETFEGMWGTPSALLLGGDGMLAGGPVVGPQEIDAFASDIRGELDSARA
jgi:hypothetical protein